MSAAGGPRQLSGKPRANVGTPLFMKPSQAERTPTRRRTQARDEPPQGRARFSPYVHAIVLASAATAVFLAGGPPQGSLGIFLALTGAALVVFPPAVRVEWPLWAASGVLVLCAALALLPESLLPIPAWRSALEALQAVPLGDSISPSPGETSFWLAVLAMSLCLGLFLLAHPLRSGRVLTLAACAASICAVYAAVAVYAKLSGWKYPFDGGKDFGFFPNRNHTAAFLVTGTLLALAVLSVAYRSRRWVEGALATSSITVCLGALGLFSESRGGVIFAIVGTLLWLAGLGALHRDRRLLTYLAIFFVAGVAAFLLVGSQARDRIVAMVLPAKTPENASGRAAATITSSEGRLLIYQDTLQMIRDYPLTGSGLGTFASIYPQYQRVAISESTARHPESDWLMLAEECGLPAVACAGLILWLLARRTGLLRTHPYWPLRWGCIVAATAALLHGMVDVPIHRVALGWWVLAIAGLGLQSRGGGEGRPCGKQRAIFVLAGVGMLLFGTRLINAEWYGGDPLAPFVAEAARDQSFEAYKQKNPLRALEIAQDGVRSAPMSGPLYFQAGELLRQFQGFDAQAELYFEAHRRINPVWTYVTLQQAQFWIDSHPERAASLWTESLDRRVRIDVATNAGEAPALGLYRDLLSAATQKPELQRLLHRETARGSAFELVWIENAGAGLVGEEIERVASDPKFLASLTPKEKERFFAAWKARGNAKTLDAFLNRSKGEAP